MTISTPRPTLRAWRKARNLTRDDVAEAVGVTPIQIGRYERAFDNPARAIPREDVLERIVAFTRGEITAADFYPPHLRAQRPAEPAE